MNTHIHSPTLLIDKTKVQNNIARMVQKAARNNVALRPHFKTHQSAAIGEWFREAGVSKITVSSIEMAAYFAEYAWNDITVAFPLNVNLIPVVDRLAEHMSLNVLVNSPTAARALSEGLQNSVGVFIELDAGQHRTGIDPNDLDRLAAILSALKAPAQLRGFLVHAGHTYAARSDEAIRSVYKHTEALLQKIRAEFEDSIPDFTISYGDTPSCTTQEGFEGIDEIRPGNFVFYDLMQVQIGCAAEHDIGVALACPVVAIHPERNEIAIHGGAIQFAKDYLVLEDGTHSFGSVVRLSPNSWSASLEGCYLKALSQEHGIINASSELLDSVQLGDMLGVLPVHSCHTVDAMGVMIDFEGQRYPIRRKHLFSGDGAHQYASANKSYSELL